MGEADQIAVTGARPITVDSLVEELSGIGVTAGGTLLAHTALRSLGWVAGGPVAVIAALQRVLTPAGTLVMPAHSSGLTDPAGWGNPPVPRVWWPVIRASTPPFDPAVTPTRQMGAVAELFRTLPGVRRSYHPHVSFAAWGRHAAAVVAGHSLEYGLGEESPLARVYDLDGHVLLLGVGHGRNTSLHLAEYRAGWDGKREVTVGAPLRVGGEARWVEFPDLDLDPFDDLARIGEDCARVTGAERAGRVGLATARLVRQRVLVDHATTWMGRNRPPTRD